MVRIIRVTSPACRWAHVPDRTPTMRCSLQILRQTFGHRCCPQLHHPTLWAVKRVVYWGKFQPYESESAILPSLTQCVDCSGGGSSDEYPSCCITRVDRHTAVSHRVAKSLKWSLVRIHS